MNRVQFASKLLLIEAKTAEARAHSLLYDDYKTIQALRDIHKQTSDLMAEILSPDETKIYIAK